MNSGPLALTGTTLGSVDLRNGASLTLTGCTFEDGGSVAVAGGSHLSLESMSVPASVLGVADHRSSRSSLRGANSTLRLDSITVPESPTPAAVLAGTVTALPYVFNSVDPPSFGVTPAFTVVSGRSCAACHPQGCDCKGKGLCLDACARWDESPPCTVSDGGRCVGRPEGYGISEECAITVGGGGGVLGPCPVFDTYSGADYVTLPGGAAHGGSDCPVGAALAPGDAIAWTSDGSSQGSVGRSYADNGCAAKGTCGLPYSTYELGGGWKLCFGMPGCTLPNAANFNPQATVDDGSCVGMSFGTAYFAVRTGPCAVSEGGRCVGRPEGYGLSEDCAITVGGGGGVLGPCPVFDTEYSGNDRVTLPGGAAHYGSDCPEGAVLASGDAIAWHSSSGYQGSVGYRGNGCAAKGTCGLPYSGHGLGGGWELCFA
eukprot:COSAG04_NODE_216_length_19953_cov_85.343558_12_plen_429_part_00